MPAYQPLGHGTHADAPITALACVPAGQSKQAEVAAGESTLLYFPTGQGEQLV